MAIITPTHKSETQRYDYRPGMRAASRPVSPWTPTSAGTADTRKAAMNAARESFPNTKAHILVVEDEEDLQALVEYNLQREGFHVTCVGTGEGALKAVRQAAPDLILLDLMLPGMDGLEVCRALRNDPALASVPVVMLTAKTEEADIVTGLELGADDYVTKPFNPRVLIARVKAVLRRGDIDEPEESGKSLRIRNVAINPERHEVRVDDEPILLTATEFRLLHLLARRPGRVFTRGEIISSIHGSQTAVTDRSVDVQVVSLRRKLGEAGTYIQTVRGVGYRFEDL